MRTLWTFGDSFTESFNTNYEWSNKYIQWKGYIPKVYGEVISDELELELVNLGKGSSDNYSIFQAVCDSVHRINSNDIIIIGWSDTIRFRLAYNQRSWQSILSNFDTKISLLKDVSHTTISEILVNRDNDLYKDEVHSWIKLLDYTFPNNLLIHWSWREFTPNYFRNISTIIDETTGLINDIHFGEEGHNQLAKKLIDMITNNQSRRLI